MRPVVARLPNVLALSGRETNRQRHPRAGRGPLQRLVGLPAHRAAPYLWNLYQLFSPEHARRWKPSDAERGWSGEHRVGPSLAELPGVSLRHAGHGARADHSSRPA